MKRQAVCSVLLIFLCTLALLFAGLNLCERGLQEVSGRDRPHAAFTLSRGEESWLITLAGREFSLDTVRLRQWPGALREWVLSCLSAFRSGAIMNWKLTGGSQCSAIKSGIFPS
ncbi:MAG: hypothetical protein KGZ79_06330 [Dethiobacter sp.]|nr:hypothetical protein [Dethiobacter sp.]